jgi:hypothetical protein
LALAGVVAGLAGLALVVVGVRPGPARLAAGPVGYVNADRPGIDAHNSPSVAVSPADRSTIVVADRTDTPRFSCSVSVSTNAGETWRALPVPLPPEAPNCHQPDVAFRGDGILVLLYTATGGRFNQPVGVWLQLYGEDLLPEGQARRVAPAEAFQAHLAVQGTGGLWVSWVQADGAADRPLGFAPGSGAVMVARWSKDQDTFTTVRVSEPGRRVVQPTPVVAGDRLVVGALDLGPDALDYEAQHGGQGGAPDPGPWSVVAWDSTDGGATFGPAVTVAAGLVPPARIIVNLAPAPSFAYDADRHRLFAAWDAGVGDARDVFLARSDDGGMTWAPPVDVAPRPRGQFLPAVGVAPDGRVDVVFYDRRRDPADLRAEVTLASSSDGGRTFRTATVSDAPFDSRIGFGGLQGIPVLGSQLAVLSQPGRALALWSDTGRGTADTGVQDLAVASVDEKAGGGQRPVLVVAGLLLLGLGGGLLVGVARLRPGDRRPQQA